MTAPIAAHLVEHGVELLLNDSAGAFAQGHDGLEVRLRSGRCLATQMVILGVGVRPENSLAVAAGLAVGARGGIRVNDHLQTEDPDIYAVGDAIEVEDFVLKGPTQVPLAGPANRQGRLAADHIFGRQDARYRGTQGTAIVGVFDKTTAMTGASEKSLKRAGLAFRKVYVHANNHAGYMPGAGPIALKVLFDPDDGRILGAQAVGGEGVDKRIDVLAVAIQAGMTVFDLEESELAYAPQYGCGQGPDQHGRVRGGGNPPWRASPDRRRGDPGGPAGSGALPARRPHDRGVRRGHIPHAVNIPLDELRSRLSEIPEIVRSPPTARSGSGANWRPASCSRPASVRPTSAAGSRPIASIGPE